MNTYKATNDKRGVMQQLADGWLLSYHPKTGAFYTYDPNRKSETFGSRSMSKTEVRAKSKKGILAQIDAMGETFRLAETPLISANTGKI
tara:strand:- start:1201 stop:1467 length:267 start_codon:yes stop_codon:yes gene_type:complete